MASKQSWYLCGGLIAMVFSLLFIGIGVFTITSMEKILKDQAAESAWLLPESYGQWGKVPGSLDVDLTRKYTFFNFTNAFEVFYFNETPKFVQTSSHIYREYQNLTDPKYSFPDIQNKNTVVDFNYQVYSLPIDASPSDLITTVNVGTLGFWYSAHNLPNHEFGTFALAATLRSLEEDIPTTLQASAIQFQCIESQEKANEILSKGFIKDAELQDFIWNDPVHGMGQRKTLPLWAHAIAGGPESGAAKMLGEYFYLTHNQLVNLLGESEHVESDLVSCVTGLNNTIKNGYNCSSIPCEPFYLVSIQWTSQEVTLHPAGGIIPAKDSVTFYNETVDGYPEISYFLKEYFIPKYKVDPKEYNLIFPVEMVSNLFNTTPSTGSKYCTDPKTLLHFGNQKFIYDIGKEFDEKLDLQILEPLRERFELPSLQHAHVLWKYIVYFESEFIGKSSIGGNKAHSIMGQVASKALYETYITVSDFLLLDLTARIVADNMTNNSIDCVGLFEISTEISIDEATLVCQAKSLTPFNLTSIKLLITICNRQGGEEYNDFMEETGLKAFDLANLCTAAAKNTFAGMMQASQLYLKNHYQCAPSYSKAKRCSSQEIAVMQWRNSFVTLNVPPVLEGTFISSDSLKDWYPSKFSKPFEYLSVLNLLKKTLSPEDLEPIDYNIAKQLLTFDRLFSPVIAQSVFIYWQTGKWSEFSETLFNIKPYPLITYLRYMIMDIGLGGFTQTRTVEELLWGYVDPFLEHIQQSDPLESGNPSLNTVISLAGANCSYEEAFAYPVSMYTGVNNTQLTRNVRQLYGLDTITFPSAHFNGNETVSDFLNPWNEPIPIKGSDGSINIPGLESNQTVPLYIMDLSFQTELVYSGNNTYYNGVNGYRYIFSDDAMKNKTNNPSNEKWYADKWDGLINISAIHSAPLFVSKAHFLDADPYLYEAIEMYEDHEMKKKIIYNKTNDFYIDIEPYSGVSLGVNAAFQANYHLKADELFKNPKEAMLPIVITQRGTKFSDEQISKVYNPLKVGLLVKKWGPLFGFVIGGILLLVSISLFIKRRKLSKEISGGADENKEADSYHIFNSSGDKQNDSLVKNANALSSQTREKWNYGKALEANTQV